MKFSQFLTELQIAKLPGLGLARHKMPQIAGDKIQAFLAKLRQDGISSRTTTIEASRLKPTQNEYNVEKVKALKQQILNLDLKPKPLICSIDNYILDGHHTWLARKEINPHYPVHVIQVNLPIKALIDVASEFEHARHKNIHETFLSFLREKKEPVTDPRQPWENPKDVENTEALKKYYDEIISKIQEAKNAFNRILKLEGQGGKVLLGLKPFDSFIDKVVKRGKPADQIHDVLRGAILMSTSEDVDRVVKSIAKRYRIYEHEVKDKEHTNEFGYYGSHHFKILVPTKTSGGVIAEIQIMTKKLWSYKSVAHDIYTKWRSSEEIDSDIRAQDVAWSKELFRLGNR
jgi:ppGpp synthetase/RelA/SpoT-type nucleotidyltranferase